LFKKSRYPGETKRGTERLSVEERKKKRDEEEGEASGKWGARGRQAKRAFE